MASKTPCLGAMGNRKAALTSECAHTFDQRCVFGCADCPECEAQGKDTPAVAPAPAPAIPSSFASTPSSSSQPASAGLFGQPATVTPTASCFTHPLRLPHQMYFSGPRTTSSSCDGSTPALGWPPLIGPSSAPGTIPSPKPTGMFRALTPSPFVPKPPTEQLSPPCSFCDGAICRGQATVTSECSHKFHLLCFPGGSVCPVCGARWRDQVVVTPSSDHNLKLFGTSPLRNPFSTLPQLSTSPSPGFTSTPPKPLSSSLPNPFSTLPLPPFSPSPPGFTSTPPKPPSSPLSNPISTLPLPPFSPSPHGFTSSPPKPPSPYLNCNPFATSPRPNQFSTLPLPPFNQSLPGFTFTPPKPSPTPPLPSPFSPSFRRFIKFADDEPVEPPLEGWDIVPEVASNGLLVLKTHCELPAVARDAAQENFAVTVHAKAPVAPTEASGRAPMDLVAVLDVSGSMAGSKLELLKQAMGFVIDKLGPSDRLSIVILSCNSACRSIRLTRMSDSGKAAAKGAVEPRRAVGDKDIGEGLRIAAQVLDDRRYKNAVSSVFLLSDGQDNLTLDPGRQGGFVPSYCAKSFIDLVPPSLRRGDGTPIHTFGFGNEDDCLERAMLGIAEAAGGTFSFIKNEAVVQDSFAQCMDGLLSVAVQEARIAVECLHPGVRVRAVRSGRYKSDVDADGRTASVDVGELYAEEERRLELFVEVPIAAAEDGDVTRLIKASCTYKDAATGQLMEVTSDDAVVQRPVVVADMEPSVDVARERFCVEAIEDIDAAQPATEPGAYAEELARVKLRLRELSARVANSHAQKLAFRVQRFE